MRGTNRELPLIIAGLTEVTVPQSEWSYSCVLFVSVAPHGLATGRPVLPVKPESARMGMVA